MKNINKLLKILLVSIIFIPINVFAYEKNESVFTTLNTDGSINKLTVTNHLTVKTKEELQDESQLNDIINLNGNETFTQDDSSIKWKADGKDIYYQGTTDKNLPLDIKINYYLDDKEMPAKDIVGKKGNIKIIISLTNNEKNTVNINGAYEEMYTPFVVMAGTIIDTKNNSDITITNGKIINTGTKSVVTSFASPGLYESLNIDNLSNMNKIEINYVTSKFELNNIYIIATPKLMDENDLQVFDNIDDIVSSINTLQYSMNQIEQGSKNLKTGTDDLVNGVKQISQNLPDESTNQENEDLLNTLKNTNDETVNKLVLANSNLNEQLTIIEGKITDATQKKEYVESQINDISQKLEAATNAYNTYSGQLAQVESAISALESLESLDEDQQVTLATLKGQQQSLSQIVPLLENQKNAIDGTYNALNATKNAIDGTLTLLNSTRDSIQTSIEANTNLAMLISGNSKVVDSSINTINSMRNLSTAMNQLSDGASKLNEGANTLQEGITKFNNEGIHTLTNYSYKIRNYSSKAEALIDLSNRYKGFTSNNSNETIFINKVKSEK